MQTEKGSALQSTGQWAVKERDLGLYTVQYSTEPETQRVQHSTVQYTWDSFNSFRAIGFHKRRCRKSMEKFGEKKSVEKRLLKSVAKV